MLKHHVKKLFNALSSNDFQTLNIIEISKSNLTHNVEQIKESNPGKNIIPILKSNAYGHGLPQVTSILNEIDCVFLGVDGYFEAAKIKDITKHKILVLGYIKPENVKLLDTRKCSFVVQDLEGLHAFGMLNKKVNIHLELNTGMNRLGLQDYEVDQYLECIKRYPKLNLQGIMTHLADADNYESEEYTTNQVKTFDKIVSHILSKGFQPKYIHIAQTAGSTKTYSKHANTIRIGIGLYGINPLNENDPFFKKLDSLKPVLNFNSTVIKTMNLKLGDRVSYNGIFTATKDMKIAILPLGYYEGIPRQLSNKGIFKFKDSELTITGRVCMNHTMVDITNTKIIVGDQINIISDKNEDLNSVYKICKLNHLFNYSYVTGLSESTRRIIVD